MMLRRLLLFTSPDFRALLPFWLFFGVLVLRHSQKRYVFIFPQCGQVFEGFVREV